MVSSTKSTQRENPERSELISGGIAVRLLDVNGIDADFVRRWHDLEKRSSENNAFLSPHFVLPAIRQLEQTKPPLFVAMEDTHASNRLIGLGVFEEARSSRLMPLAHLQDWRCDYSLFVGMLIDEKDQSTALNSFFEWLTQNSSQWHGLVLRDHAATTSLACAMKDAAEHHGLVWHDDWSNERAAINVASIPDDIMPLYSKSRRKTIARNTRKLEQYGRVSFSLQRKGDDFEAALATFFRLEGLGWKGDAGSAMISQPKHAQFGRDVAAGFAQDNRLVIGELRVDDEVIASTLNLISGNTLFALKIGWDPKYANASPGTQSELQLLKHVSKLDGIEFVDSCAHSGSYVEDVWPWRKKLTTGVFAASTMGNLAAGMMQNVKSIKRWLKQL
jgi:CelD/BcsL family acetyltransferase involved in cellulose biosynthesis